MPESTRGGRPPAQRDVAEFFRRVLARSLRIGAVGHAFVGRDCVAVLRSPLRGSEDQHVEGAVNEVGAGVGS